MHEDGGVEKKRHENLWRRSTAQFDLLKGLAVAVQMTHKHVIYVPALDVTQYMPLKNKESNYFSKRWRVHNMTGAMCDGKRGELAKRAFKG